MLTYYSMLSLIWCSDLAKHLKENLDYLNKHLSPHLHLPSSRDIVFSMWWLDEVAEWIGLGNGETATTNLWKKIEQLYFTRNLERKILKRWIIVSKEMYKNSQIKTNLDTSLDNPAFSWLIILRNN